MAHGPYAADGFFGSGAFKQFDGVLAMYHDQGLGSIQGVELWTRGQLHGRTCLWFAPALITERALTSRDKAKPTATRSAKPFGWLATCADTASSTANSPQIRLKLPHPSPNTGPVADLTGLCAMNCASEEVGNSNRFRYLCTPQIWRTWIHWPITASLLWV